MTNIYVYKNIAYIIQSGLFKIKYICEHECRTKEYIYLEYHSYKHIYFSILITFYIYNNHKIPIYVITIRVIVHCFWVKIRKTKIYTNKFI